MRSFGERARDVAVALLEGTLLTPPEDLAQVLRDAAQQLGAEAVAHLVDYDQRVLVPFLPRGAAPQSPTPIEGTMAGRAFQLVEPVPVPAESRLWLPLLDGADRLGVVEVVHPGDADVTDPETIRAWRWLTNLIGQLVTVKNGYGDGLDQVRRLRPRSVASELLWQILPSLTFGTEQFVIAAMLEPTYDVGGDAFDYGLEHQTLNFAVFDAMGHSLSAGLVAAVALASYRNSRREGRDLAEAAELVDAHVAEQFGGERYATGVLAELDLRDGHLRYVAAGHPCPLVLRRGRVVKELDGGRRLPFGWQLGTGSVGQEQLEPGDWLVLHTDGVTEARDPEGRMFGQARLVDMLEREAASGHPAPETLRRLVHAVLDHQQGRLQDDATVLVVQWLQGTERYRDTPPEPPLDELARG